ncbi:hypothetical protein FRB99_002441, partial [Tulasnella sp. 403]
EIRYGINLLTTHQFSTPYPIDPEHSQWVVSDTVEPSEELFVTWLQCIEQNELPNQRGVPYVNLDYRVSFRIPKTAFLEPGFLFGLYAINEIHIQSMIKWKLAISAPFEEPSYIRWPSTTPAGFVFDENSIDRWHITMPDANMYSVYDWATADRFTIARSNLDILDTSHLFIRDWVNRQRQLYHQERYIQHLVEDMDAVMNYEADVGETD